MTYKPNYFNFRELPRWKRWLVYGWFQFYILLQIFTAYSQIEGFYNQATSGAEVPFVTLSTYTQLKRNLLKFGISEESHLVHTVDNVGESAYRQGISILPKEDGEQHIWYYWRYLEPYPEQFTLSKNKQIKLSISQFLSALNGLSLLPMSNAGLNDKLRYNILSHLLRDYINYLQGNSEDLQTNKIYIRNFIVSYYSNMERLLKNFSLPEDASTYIVFGNLLNSMYIIKSNDLTCDDISFKVYHNYINNTDQLLQKTSPKIRKKVEALLHDPATRRAGGIINNKIDAVCKTGGNNE